LARGRITRSLTLLKLGKPLLLAVLLVALLPATAQANPLVKRVKIHYRAHNGVARAAYILLPSWYGPRNHPAIPLVISPHGRGLNGLSNSRIWGALPAVGQFAVVSPDGMGRVLDRYSWGSYGQIEDLAKMPKIVHLALPWLTVDPQRVYAFGGSMGGQETLLLLARHPKLLAGAAVFDAVTDFARQYRRFPDLGCTAGCRKTWKGSLGRSLQQLARREIGASPKKAPAAWKERSPITYAGAIARSCVPLQLWWSTKDKIVLDQQHQSQKLFDELRRLNPQAPVSAYVGWWRHSAEMHAKNRLPLALTTFGLLPPEHESFGRSPLKIIPAASQWCAAR
jgi:pimeloyl-ACP methyl ester carboxylesterase